MKKVISSLFAVFFIGGIFVSTAIPQTDRIDEAPMIIPPATEEMQHPEFWIKRIKNNPDRVIMTLGEIAELNKKNRLCRFNLMH